MENPGYVSLARQSGLMSEMRAVANNIANLSTTGFRKEGLVFAEHVADLEGIEPSLSTASGVARVVDLSQGPIRETRGTFDFAIEGEGFFLLGTPGGERLTRAGAFTLSPEGTIVTAEGFPLLDAGGAPVAVPPGASVSLASDGTLSAGGAPVAQIGLYMPADPAQLRHEAGTMFAAGETVPAEGAAILQGFLEGSNVNPVREISRMIEVQRAYELGQGLLDREDQRIRAVIETVGR